MSSATVAANAAVQEASAFLTPLFSEINQCVVGQRYLLERLVIGLLANGHVLLEGVPGLAKTLSVKTLATALHVRFSRIQFTPDMLPADVVGTQVYNPQSGAFTIRRGPVFANLVLADEINRAPAKVQSALLEAMQERQVTAAGRRHGLPRPFFVLATQNPIEMEGTYPLPEAQLDRFLFNVVVDYLPEADEVRVIQRTTGAPPEPIEPLFNGEDVLAFHALVRQVPVSEDLVRHAVRLAAATRPRRAGTPDFINESVTWGAGTRAPQCLVLGAKARALLRGRAHVTLEDLHELAVPVLRHRVLLNYRAEADGLRIDDLIRRLVESVDAPGS